MKTVQLKKPRMGDKQIANCWASSAEIITYKTAPVSGRQQIESVVISYADALAIIKAMKGQRP